MMRDFTQEWSETLAALNKMAAKAKRVIATGQAPALCQMCSLWRGAIPDNVVCFSCRSKPQQGVQSW